MTPGVTDASSERETQKLWDYSVKAAYVPSPRKEDACGFTSAGAQTGAFPVQKLCISLQCEAAVYRLAGTHSSAR